MERKCYPPTTKTANGQISAREESDVRQTRLSIPSRARALPAKGVSDLDSAPMRKRLHRVADGGGSLLFRPHSGVTVFVTFVNGVAHSCGYNFTITIGMWALNQSVMQWDSSTTLCIAISSGACVQFNFPPASPGNFQRLLPSPLSLCSTISNWHRTKRAPLLPLSLFRRSHGTR